MVVTIVCSGPRPRGVVLFLLTTMSGRKKNRYFSRGSSNHYISRGLLPRIREVSDVFEIEVELFLHVEGYT